MTSRQTTLTKLLDAAEDLFFTQGIAATPIDAVLERAGVSSATLYRAYSSKEVLVAAVLDRRHAAWIAGWDAALADAATPTQALLSVFDANDAFRSGPRGARWCAFLNTAAEFADPPPQIAEVLARETATYRERLTRLAREAGAADPEALADQLLLVVSGDLAMHLRRDAEAPASTARTVAAAVVAAALP